MKAPAIVNELLKKKGFFYKKGSYIKFALDKPVAIGLSYEDGYDDDIYLSLDFLYPDTLDKKFYMSTVGGTQIEYLWKDGRLASNNNNMKEMWIFNHKNPEEIASVLDKYLEHWAEVLLSPDIMLQSLDYFIFGTSPPPIFSYLCDLGYPIGLDGSRSSSKVAYLILAGRGKEALDFMIKNDKQFRHVKEGSVYKKLWMDANLGKITITREFDAWAGKEMGAPVDRKWEEFIV